MRWNPSEAKKPACNRAKVPIGAAGPPFPFSNFLTSFKKIDKSPWTSMKIIKNNANAANHPLGAWCAVRSLHLWSRLHTSGLFMIHIKEGHMKERTTSWHTFAQHSSRHSHLRLQLPASVCFLLQFGPSGEKLWNIMKSHKDQKASLRSSKAFDRGSRSHLTALPYFETVWHQIYEKQKIHEIFQNLWTSAKNYNNL